MSSSSGHRTPSLGATGPVSRHWGDGCLKNAHTKADRDACEATYAQESGEKPDGGKVFEAGDGTATFVTDLGKVFTGGKVF